MKVINSILLIMGFACSLFAQDSSQSFLSLRQTGVEEFLQKNPTYDGRGTVIYILDTGVDIGINGLTKTPDGEVKVIDVHDFTGQGDLNFYAAEMDEEDGEYFFINEEQKLKVAGANKLELKAFDDEYYIGAFEEKFWLNSGSKVTDINGDGDINDIFHFVVFNVKDNNSNDWVVYFDTNANGDVSDEKPIRNYNEKFDQFGINNIEKGYSLITFAVNILPGKEKISLYFDDGSHGTHCAGTAAGYKIGGEFNGVAPGAYLGACKLGNNNFAGGASVTESMKKSYIHVDKVSKETNMPVIINMSFGVGSVIEGHSDMEKYLYDLSLENPYLYISLSSGNNGPGISTTGQPSSSKMVMSSGAVLTKEVANDVYGASISKDIILHFSSRGAEVFKPSVVAPGASVSTIPNYDDWDVMWGTSMAAPYTAGVMSLLLSAAKQEFPDVKVPAQVLYKAIREGASHFEGYDPIDQGGGYINVINSWELLKKYLKNDFYKSFETYAVSALSPNMPNDIAENLYIRNGNYLDGTETFSYSIKRNNTINKSKFYRIYNLKSNVDWLKPIQQKIRFRNDQDASVKVKLDKSKMTKPGLYNGIIKAYRSDAPDVSEIEMMATVVIPHEFGPCNNFNKRWEDEAIDIGDHKRFYFNVPAGASSMSVDLSSDENEYTNLWYFIHKPDGSKLTKQRFSAYREEAKKSDTFYNIEPGVYELVVLGFYKADQVSHYDLAVEFGGINRIGNDLITEHHNKITVINQFNKLKTVSLSGEIHGFKNTSTVELKGYDQYEIPFTLNKSEESKVFTLMLTKEDFNKVTDFAFMIYNDEGKAVSVSGLGSNEGTIKVKNTFDAENTNLRLVLIPGFAHAESSMNACLTETTYLKNKIELNAMNDGSKQVDLYPSVTEEILLKFENPQNSNEIIYIGDLYFKSKNKLEYQLPLEFKF